MKTKKTQVNKSPIYRDLPLDSYKEFYKLLVTHNYAEAASQIGMNSHYEGDALRRVGYQIYKDIVEKVGVENLDIGEDVQEMVSNAIEERKVYKGRSKPEKPAELEFTPTELLDPNDTKRLVVGGRNKAAMLLHKKFDLINKNKKALDSTSLSQLGTVFGILFDKSQVLQGEATENIAVMSKNIKDSMTADESLDAILRMREATTIEKSE